MVDPVAPVSSGEYAVGDVIADKYRLERLLGEGGQAWVWQAKNLALDASVAIKVLRSGEDDAPQAHRLLQEARTAASLGHPAIVRVFDLGQAANGNPFLVMEFLEGESLADRLFVQERLAPIEAIRVLLPIADALAAAHAKGIVHRDLKPDNVFLARSEDGLQPKLLDFGIVKVDAASDWQRLSTLTGAIVGSPAYLSPEQARGLNDVDQRVDVWGLCVTLYECLTGELPFDGANYNALLRSIVEDEPDSIVERGVDEPELWQIVKRGLAKSREERWSSTRELGRALAEWLSQRGVLDDASRALLDGKWLRSRASSASHVPREGQSPRARVNGRRVALGALATFLLIAVAVLVAKKAPSPAEAPSEPKSRPAPSSAMESRARPASGSPASAAVAPPAMHEAEGRTISVTPVVSDAGAPRPPRTNATASTTRPPPPPSRAAPSADLYLISPY